MCEGQGEIFEGNKQIVAWQDPKGNCVPPQKRASWTESVPKSLVIKTRLTPAEMKARREKKLCYNCDEKWVRGHRCKGKLFRLSAEGNVLTEVTDEGGEEQEEFVDAMETIQSTEVSKISLYALTSESEP